MRGRRNSLVRPSTKAPTSAERSKVIPEGRCGFKNCTADRIGGVWVEGGSRLCKEHRDILMSIRALYDRHSKVAEEYRKLMELDPKKRDYKGPTCVRPGCDNPRLGTDAYCDACQEQGYREEME